ncbi:MAG: TonB-dependent receptor plug domain-containing protein [Gemmatimonadetes bacterium]|nr:TonB-dependent receptor plug domain-containing protein [Gemmatimonadota bacterium]
MIRLLTAVLFLLVPVAPIAAQSRTVAGRVVDRLSGRPIASGQVTVKGARASDAVRPDGVFVLHAPNRELTLVIKTPGYRSREITIGPGEQILTVFMESLTLRLPSTTVTGTSARSTTTIIGAAVDRSSLTVPVALRGQVPGIEVRQNSGAPGDVQLQMRGITTLFGTATPLYVLDGVILSDAAVGSGISAITGGQETVVSRIVDLNPQDIESIELLKGAAATAMYGSRGANGVVVIRTWRSRRH